MSEITVRLDEIAGLLRLLCNAQEEKGKSPHTPLKEKGEAKEPNPRACACAREGSLVPTLEEVVAYAPTLGIGTETAEEFWYNCDATGWKHKGSYILNWRSMLKSWHLARSRMDARDEKLTAHIDAKMDAREERRERRSRRKKVADNFVQSTPEQRKEFDDAKAW